jgi:hypothetical protein
VKEVKGVKGVKGQTESTRVQFLRTAQSAPSLLAFESNPDAAETVFETPGPPTKQETPSKPSTSFSPKGWPAFRRTAVEGLSGARPPADAFTGDKTRISPKGTEPSDTFDHFSRPSILSVPFVPIPPFLWPNRHCSATSNARPMPARSAYRCPLLLFTTAIRVSTFTTETSMI